MGLFAKLIKKKEEKVELPNEEKVAFEQIVKIFNEMNTPAFNTRVINWSSINQLEARSSASILINRSVKSDELIYKYSCNRARFVKNGKFGFYDELAFEVVPPIYDKASDFVHDIAVVEIDGKLGIIGKNNETIIPCEYENLKLKTEWAENTVFNISGMFQCFGELVAVRTGEGLDIYSKNGEGLLYKSNEKYGSIKYLNQYCSFDDSNIARFINDVEYLTKFLKEKQTLYRAGKISKESYLEIKSEIYKMVEESFRSCDFDAYKKLYNQVEEVAKLRPNNPIYKHVLKNKEKLTHVGEYLDPHPACCSY